MTKRRTDKEFRDIAYQRVGDEYTFLEEYRGAKEKIKVRHNDCGREYLVRPQGFFQGDRCYPCSKKKQGERITKTHREFSKELEEESESMLIPLEEYVGSQTKIKFLHKRCGMTFKTTPNIALRTVGCPYCRGKGVVNTKEFSEVVRKKEGGEYEVLGEFAGRLTPVDVRHVRCDYVWGVMPVGVYRHGIHCPSCSESRGERGVKEALEELGVQYERERRAGKVFGNKSLRFDFYLAEYRACIEFDGRQHFEAVESWGGEAALIETQSRDSIKNLYCGHMGIKLLRIPYWEFDNISRLVEDFVNTLN